MGQLETPTSSKKPLGDRKIAKEAAQKSSCLSARIRESGREKWEDMKSDLNQVKNMGSEKGEGHPCSVWPHRRRVNHSRRK